MKLRTIDEHCGELYLLIVQGTDYFIERSEWQQPLASLKLASGLKSIEYDTVRFDPSFGWCGNGDICVGYQDDLEAILTLSLCRFHFIWSALEATINISVPAKLDKSIRGKISNACLYLKQNRGFHPKFEAYLIELANLEKLLIEDSFYSEIFLNIDIPQHVNEYGKGIFLAYKLRNLLAHGSLGIPETQQEEESHLDSQIIHSITRLVLLTIQTLAIIDLHDDFPIFSWSYIDIPIEDALTNIQFDASPEDIFEDQESPFNKDQLKFEFE
ncbi:hypothetical protein DS2_12654 [Catenovulum agarivorans DS-2]|uniref:Apea-like HEPN domain-containing protein n=1 Tax=Catenovulum agarivorans DS-2 TaxID=1328313 RepID=W7QVS4_9ALTE|nr:hypothetical protein [Catenovulum agarivorans]EWH09385.1 hypothetical protein DS2_12654 [Catenovulum agarivorans DS-2]